MTKINDNKDLKKLKEKVRIDSLPLRIVEAVNETDGIETTDFSTIHFCSHKIEINGKYVVSVRGKKLEVHTGRKLVGLFNSEAELTIFLHCIKKTVQKRNEEVKITKTEVKTMAKNWYDFFLKNHKEPETVKEYSTYNHLYIGDVEDAINKKVVYIVMHGHSTESGNAEVFYFKPLYEHKNKTTRTENS